LGESNKKVMEQVDEILQGSESFYLPKIGITGKNLQIKFIIQ
jgi:hypothetical protein